MENTAVQSTTSSVQLPRRCYDSRPKVSLWTKLATYRTHLAFSEVLRHTFLISLIIYLFLCILFFC